MDEKRLNYIMDMDKNKRTKYILSTKSEYIYSFVTNKLNDEESIMILKEKVELMARKSSLHYYINKIKNGEKELIYEGRVKPSI